MHSLQTGTWFDVADLTEMFSLARARAVRIRVATDHECYEEMVEVAGDSDRNLAEWLIWRCAETGAIFLDGARGHPRTCHGSAFEALLYTLREHGP